MGAKLKFKKKFTKELLNGLRRNPDVYCGTEYLMSIERICWKWGITPRTYWNWVNEYTSFREAHEQGHNDFLVCCQEWVTKEGMKGKHANSILTKYLMGNIGSEMTDKKEVTQTVNENRIQKIEIEVIQPKSQLEHKEPIDITAEVKESNVVEIIPSKLSS